MKKNRLLRVAEAAELLDKTEGTMRYWRSIGYGPRSAKLGRSVVYREDEVLAWLDAQFDDAS